MEKSNLLLTIFLLLCSCSKLQKPYDFGGLVVNEKDKTIVFEATYNGSCKEPYFLFYFKGYPWLKDVSLFESSSNLKDLQMAIAYLDWRLWDKIYVQNLPHPLRFYIELNKRWIKLDEFIELKFATGSQRDQVVFFGSPIYDPAVLSQDYKDSVVCLSCYYLPLERKIFLDGLKPFEYKFLSGLKHHRYKFKIVVR